MSKKISLILILTALAIAGYARDNDNRHEGRRVIRSCDKDNMSEKEKAAYSEMKARMEAMKTSWEKDKNPEKSENFRQYKRRIEEKKEHYNKRQNNKEKMRDRLSQCLKEKKLTDAQKTKIENSGCLYSQYEASKNPKVLIINVSSSQAGRRRGSTVRPTSPCSQ